MTAGALSIDGTVTGSSIGGSVDLDGTAGNLVGEIGFNGAIGAFSGGDTGRGFAGGFLVTP